MMRPPKPRQRNLPRLIIVRSGTTESRGSAFFVAHSQGQPPRRNLGRPGTLEAAADYVEAQWRSNGYEVRRQVYEVRGVASANLEAILAGDERAQEILVIGAHYDTLRGSPGANDNASREVSSTTVRQPSTVCRASAGEDLNRCAPPFHPRVPRFPHPE